MYFNLARESDDTFNGKPHKIVTPSGKNSGVKITTPADPEKVAQYHSSLEYKRIMRAKERAKDRENKHGKMW